MKKRSSRSFTFNNSMQSYKQRKFIVPFLVVLALAVLYFWSPFSCSSDSCFLEYGNECKPASITNALAGMSVKIETKDCVLYKTVIEAPDDGVGSQFLGASMSCPYAQGELVRADGEFLIANVERCSGSLRDLIYRYLY